MTASRFYFCALPPSIWNSNNLSSNVSLADLAYDALACERRILKEVNLDGEQLRYTLTCQQIEQTVLDSGLMRLFHNPDQFVAELQKGHIPTQVSEGGYLALMAHSLDEDDRKKRLGASFYPPNQVDDHYQLFSQWLERKQLENLAVAHQRLVFLEQAQKYGCAVVEIQSAFLPIGAAEIQTNWDIYRTSRFDENENIQIIIPEFEITGEAVTFFTEKSKQKAAQQLREQVRAALENSEPITLGNQARHDVITEVLHEFVYAPGPQNRSGVLRIAYVDGSEGEPFPIFCLQKGDIFRSNNTDALSAALMSVRHYELDEKIDFCWFRNREVSRSRTLAESDNFCYKTSLAQLRVAKNDGNFKLDLYHTGFEPAVIGFYRALVRVMLDDLTHSQVSVRPMYFRGKAGYEAGSVWGS